MEDVDTLTCTLEEGEDHTHTERCYGTWELICGKEEHTHTEECMLVDEEEPVGNGEDSSEPVGYADDGETMQMLYAARQDSDHFVTYHKDITSLLSSVEIYNSNNELV